MSIFYNNDGFSLQTSISHKEVFNNRDTHASLAISGMNAGSQIQPGRPFVGVAILWDKMLNNYIQTVDTSSKRIAAILYTRNVFTLLFITAYMPCDTGTCDITKVDEFSKVLNRW